jgi:MerR family copper efflux transcriptional regulator
LLGLWQDRSRPSREVKRLAQEHIDDLESRIRELMAMKETLADLVRHCKGNARPDCPILDELSGQHRDATVAISQERH